ncbi:RcnB family protein [Terricaulis silvestris]|uniref:Putative integral membrane protein n=1 Tax=Terricaulis silvestris TaxID=2686094 RepID=A0A6I6MN17_9CAUL|nr:RcnB family protein [Terricaulis silvestris]QGZ94768.1 putative integral membrane protein [Terricaulis silvestris]
MKRFVMAALAAATFAAPLALPAQAAAQHRDRDWDRDRDRGDRDRDRDYDRRDRDGRWDRDDRRDRRDRGRHRGWDHSRYNGYNYRGRWYYGPPPAAYRDYADYGYRSWRRGDRLPSYYRTRYVEVRDYDRYGYRRPPRGYHYVRDDRGDLLLVGIATGVILGIMLADN